MTGVVDFAKNPSTQGTPWIFGKIHYVQHKLLNGVPKQVLTAEYNPLNPHSDKTKMHAAC